MSPQISTTSTLLISQIAQLQRLTAKRIEEALKPIGITYQEMRIVGLMMGESGITQKQLAEKLSVRAATLSVAIGKLETRGLVKRVVNPEDKREQFLALKPNRRIREVDALLLEIENSLTSGLPTNQLEVANTVLSAMIQNLHPSQKEIP